MRETRRKRRREQPRELRRRERRQKRIISRKKDTSQTAEHSTGAGFPPGKESHSAARTEASMPTDSSRNITAESNVSELYALATYMAYHVVALRRD